MSEENASRFVNKVIQRYIEDPYKKIKLKSRNLSSGTDKEDFARKHYTITVTKENCSIIKDVPEKKRKDFIKLILNSMLSIPDEWIQEEFKVTLPKKKAKEEAAPAVEGPEEESIIIEGSVDGTDGEKDYSVTQAESQITEITEAQDINGGTYNDYAETSMEKKWDKYTIQDEWKLSDDYVIGALGNLNNMD